MTELDEIDWQIVQALRNDARITNKDLAERLSIAPSTCLERVRRLHERKVIIGHHAELNPKALGLNIQAMIAVRLGKHARKQITAFHDAMLAMPETVTLYHISGAFDYLVHVMVRDTDALRDLILNGFTERPEVEHVETHLIFEQARSLSLPELE
ncbi:MAG: Lrp/AsnC family transcriptional regulator [Gammaproteobacteria bacterium]|nr:Lrp/AsnC family transcriptional regulator [Gammaproteobacteria bacterium]